MSKKKKHKTTKNTVAKPPITKLAVISGDINGSFELVTDLSGETFDKLYRTWFDHPDTKMWCVEALINYIKDKHPKCICLLKNDYEQITKGKVVPATKEEWEAENN